MLRSSFLLLLCLSLADAYAQCGVRQPRAFWAVQSPGNIPVDDLGRPLQPMVDTTWWVVLEGGMQRIDQGYAWMGSRLFRVQAERLDERMLEVGREPGAERSLQIHARGGRLWQLQLTRSSERRQAPGSVRSGALQLHIRIDGKPCRLLIPVVRRIELPPSV